MHFIVKKTLEIIINSCNNYLVKLKGNAKKLSACVKRIVGTQRPISSSIEHQRTKGREEARITKLYSASSEGKSLISQDIAEDWAGLNRIITQERMFVTKHKIHNTKSYYISSVNSEEAKTFSEAIRGHWYIENKLHWVKDVIQQEDTSAIKNGNAPENMSIIKDIAINIARQNGYESVKHASIYFQSNAAELLRLLFRT